MAVYKCREKWRAKVYVGNKIIATKSGFKRKGDAQRWHDEMKVKFRESPEAFAAEKKFTFEELLERFYQFHLPDVRPSTKRRYLIDIKYRIEPYFKFQKLDKIDLLFLEGFKSDIRKNLKPKTVNNCLGLLNLLLNKAVQWKMMDQNPNSLSMLKVKKGNEYKWWDSHDDIETFLTTVKERSRYYPAYLLALETGMRLGEIVGLSKADVDFEEGRIKVWRQWLEKEMSYGPTKNGESRWIDFDPNGLLAKVLKRAIAESTHGEAIFVTRTGNRVRNRKLAGDHFGYLVEKSGVPNITFHGMRHTFASWYMIQEDNIWALQYLMGHRDLKATQIYAHLSKRQRRRPLNLSEKINSAAKVIKLPTTQTA